MKNTVSVLVAFAVAGAAPASMAALPDGSAKAPASSAVLAARGVGYALKEGDAEVTFTAIGQPSALKIVGKTQAAKGVLELRPSGAAGEFTVELATMDTGIGLRNRHMKEKYLETGKFPQAVLRITRLGSLKSGSPIVAGSLPFEGRLTLHGVTHDQNGTLEILDAASAETVPVRAKMELKLSDYGIQIPSFAGITFAEQVVVAVEGKVARAP